MFRPEKGGVPVMVGAVRIQESSPIVTVTGTLVPNDHAYIKFPNEVKISEVFVKKGDRVAAGDVLFRLADEDMNVELNSLDARRRELEALIDKHNYQLRNREKMLEEGKIEQDEYTRLEKETATNEASLESAKADIAKLRYNLDHSVVASPITGVIVEKDLSAGIEIGAEKELLKIVNVDPIIVAFALNAKQSENVAVGTPLSVKIIDLQNKKFTANVTYISPELHRTGKTFEVWAAIPNSEYVLKSGMRAGTEFVSDVQTRTYLVPASSVLSKFSKPYVYKVSRGIAYKTPITIGAITDDQIEVLGGLGADDLVVVRGGEDLFDGAVVDIWRR